MNKSWIPKNFDEVCRRAAGRRRYHATRQKKQFERQMKVLGELERADWENYGMGRMLARKLGVSEPTICRDIRHLRDLRRKLGPDAKKTITLGLSSFQTALDS